MRIRTIMRLVGRALFGKRRLKEAREKRGLRLEGFACRRQKALQELREQIAGFPGRKLTAEELAAVPKGKDVDLYACPIGTWFVCTPHKDLPGMVVLGHVVDGMDAIVNQFGGGTCIPKRFVNRYRAVVA
ncbi:MAG TPA: hypothetical protein VHE10_01145 [Candidatus Paceibacterota bacterium]|nr:hypothetical protein [Candidatus Paceibacterota bacterium]